MAGRTFSCDAAPARTAAAPAAAGRRRIPNGPIPGPCATRTSREQGRRGQELEQAATPLETVSGVKPEPLVASSAAASAAYLLAPGRPWASVERAPTYARPAAARPPHHSPAQEAVGAAATGSAPPGRPRPPRDVAQLRREAPAEEF